MIGSVAATALAQQVPVQVVQGSDGTLYLEQGSNSWTLVPNQIIDSDAAALNPSGEIDGTLPNQLFVVQAPTSPPAAAPAPAAPAAPAAAAPAPAAPVDKIVGNYTTNYGAQAVVTISGSDGGYTVTAKGPLRWKPAIIAAPGCDLPDGTVIATFSLQSGTSYSGQHGSWDKSCQFVQWGPMQLDLKGTLLTGSYNFFTVGGVAPATTTFSRT